MREISSRRHYSAWDGPQMLESHAKCMRFDGCTAIIYATADEADAYMFYICFFLFFSCFFSVRHKNTRQPFSGMAERIFRKLLPNDSGDNVVCIALPKWGLGPPINFLGAKNYTLRTWWWRLVNEWETLLYAGLLAMALCSYGGHCALSGDPWRMTEKRLR